MLFLELLFHKFFRKDLRGIEWFCFFVDYNELRALQDD